MILITCAWQSPLPVKIKLVASVKNFGWKRIEFTLPLNKQNLINYKSHFEIFFISFFYRYDHNIPEYKTQSKPFAASGSIYLDGVLAKVDFVCD